jgi:hypothetical protein
MDVSILNQVIDLISSVCESEKDRKVYVAALSTGSSIDWKRFNHTALGFWMKTLKCTRVYPIIVYKTLLSLLLKSHFIGSKMLSAALIRKHTIGAKAILQLSAENYSLWPIDFCKEITALLAAILHQNDVVVIQMIALQSPDKILNNVYELCGHTLTILSLCMERVAHHEDWSDFKYWYSVLKMLLHPEITHSDGTGLRLCSPSLTQSVFGPRVKNQSAKQLFKSAYKRLYVYATQLPIILKSAVHQHLLEPLQCMVIDYILDPYGWVSTYRDDQYFNLPIR